MTLLPVKSIMRERRSVAPVIATLLMVAIAVVGGMLVFVFAQDFFTQTDSMTGPTIELLQIVGYDARDITGTANLGIKNHEGDECLVRGLQDSIMDDGDVFSIFVRNLGGNDIILSDVRVYGVSAIASNGVLALVAEPDAGNWTVATNDDCISVDPTPASSNVIGAGRDATVFIGYSTGVIEATVDMGDAVKVGRPIFVTLETGAGNVFSKTVINGRSLG